MFIQRDSTGSQRNSLGVNPESSIIELENIERSLTFKDLGIISTDKSPLRPTTSRVFNIVKTVAELDAIELDVICLDDSEAYFTSNGKVLTVSIDTENRVMLPSSTQKYLGVQGLPNILNE
jgi:hypothetical protein